MLSGFRSLEESFTNFVPNIIQGIGDLLKSIFVPDTENFNIKLDSIKSRFNFASQISNTIDIFMNFFESNDFANPPSISINFGNARGKYNYGGVSKALDFAWYAEFKPIVDKIIIGFSYGGFLWITFMRLPDIINGSGALFVNASKISNYKKEN